MSKPRRFKPEIRKESIITAALYLAEQTHYRELTRDQIGARCAITGTAVMYHFHTMAKLRRDIMRECRLTRPGFPDQKRGERLRYCRAERLRLYAHADQLRFNASSFHCVYAPLRGVLGIGSISAMNAATILTR